MDIINPFQDDEIKNIILEREGKKDPDDYELLDNNNSDLKSIISGKPIIPNKAAKNLFMDASALAKSEKSQKAGEITQALNSVFTKYNETYGLDLSLDFNNLANTLVSVSDEKNQAILQNYLSLTFRSFKSVMVLHLLNRVVLAIDYITDPSRMLSQEFTPQDQVVLTERLIGMIAQIDELKKDIVIEGDIQTLKKLSEDEDTGASNIDDLETREVVEGFMKLFSNEKLK